jgi:hypothetical protein
VTHPFVEKIRADLSGNGFQMPDTHHHLPIRPVSAPTSTSICD